NFGEVHYQSLYSGIDLVARDDQSNLDYVYLVAAGADASQIKMDYGSTATPSLDANGGLVLALQDGSTATQAAPVLYQETANGQKQHVAGSYVLLGGSQVGFQIGAYDHSRPLFIDPTLVFST